MADSDFTAKDFYVYVHKRASDGRVFYVGKGRNFRAFSKKGRNEYWHRIVAKHGYTVEIVQSGMQEWWAFELECELIALYGRENLCNLTDGGEGVSGAIRSEESKRKASQSHLRPEVQKSKSLALRLSHQDPEVKKRRSESLRKTYASEELRKRVSESLIQTLKNPIYRKQRSEARIGKKHSHEAKQNMRIAALNMSEEHKEKLSFRQLGELNHAAKKIVCIETGVVYVTMKSATDWLKTIGKTKAQTSPITKCIKGIYLKAYGFTWAYA